MEGKKQRRADRRKYHYIYKTTCKITNKYYIGMHSTDNLEDGYVGSGKRLWYSINKHGKDNHEVEILEFLPDRISLKEREREIVNYELINEELCMNLQLGGGGGFSNKEHQRKAQESSRNSYRNRLKNDKAFFNKISEGMTRRNLGNKYGIGNKSFSGRAHLEETKRKIGESNSKQQSGSKNSQFGTCWIFNDETKQSIKIKKDELQSYLDQGWFKGRKIKFN